MAFCRRCFMPIVLFLLHGHYSRTVFPLYEQELSPQSQRHCHQSHMREEVPDSYVYHYGAAIVYAVEPSKEYWALSRWWSLCRAQGERSRDCVIVRSGTRWFHSDSEKRRFLCPSDVYRLPKAANMPGTRHPGKTERRSFRNLLSTVPKSPFLSN